MHFHVLRTLLRKEVHRHLLNRGGLALGGLLIVAALMLSLFNPGAAGGAGTAGGGQGAAETGGVVGGIHHCYVLYAVEDAFVRHLKANVPDEMKQAVVFRPWRAEDVKELVAGSPGLGTIVIKHEQDPAGKPVLRFEVWHPRDNPGAMAGYEQWFWKAARRALQVQAVLRLKLAGADASRLPEPELDGDDLWAVLESYRSLGTQVELIRTANGAEKPAVPLVPAVVIERKGLAGQPIDLRAVIATAMVVFALYFSCVYLLPTLNCEERERGVLLAQALSPASPTEILTAKFLFYPTLGVGLAATLAGIYKPAVLLSLFFWLSVFTVACGFLGIGMTVAALSKTQRAAFLGAMCYLLSVTLILMICQQNNIPFVPYLTIEYHGPRVLHAAITGEYGHYWINLLAAAGLAAGWVWTAGALFRRRGWQ